MVESVIRGRIAPTCTDWGFINMEEKFLKLSKIVRWIILLGLWLLTVASLLGCLLVKKYMDNYALQISLSCVGILCSVVAICFTIIQLSGRDNTPDESNK